MKSSIIQIIQVEFNFLLQSVVEGFDLVLGLTYEPVNLNHGLGEPLQAAVELVVPVEADPEGTAADQCEERETTSDGAGLALPVVLGVAAPRQEVDQQDDQGQYQPGSGH